MNTRMKLTAAEKKEIKIKKLMEIRGGLIIDHHQLDVEISKKHLDMKLSDIEKAKQELLKRYSKIKRVTNRLKKLGVIFEED